MPTAPRAAPTARRAALCCGVRAGSPPKVVRLTAGETSTKKEMTANAASRGPRTAQRHITSQSKAHSSALAAEGGGGRAGFVSIDLTLLRHRSRRRAKKLRQLQPQCRPSLGVAAA